MKVNISNSIDIELQQIMTGRSCIIGQSGSGKSFLMGVIAEELCKAKMPFVIIDTEGEYFNIKSIFNAIWVSENESADLKLDSDYGRIIKNSIESHTPIILDVSESYDRVGIVYSFLEKLYKIEDEIKEPFLVMIEEADKFIPQVVKKELNPIEEISVRGRKRGIGLIIATQRPANISKNVLSQCGYGFIGKLTLENDLSAISILFDDKNIMKDIPKLGSGEFMMFGSGSNIIFKVKRRLLNAMGTTPLVKELNNEVDMKSIIDNIRSGSKNGPNNKLTKNDNVFNVITSEFTEEDAMEYARSHSSIFGINLRRTDIESPISVYMPLLELRILTPKGRKSDFEIHYIMVNNSMKFLNSKKMALEGIPNTDIELKKNETHILEVIAKSKSIDIENICRVTGISRLIVAKLLARLVSNNLVVEIDGQFNVPTNKIETDKIQLSTAAATFKKSQILGSIDTSKILKRMQLLFPDSKVNSMGIKYLKFYLVKIRYGSTIRIMLLDSCKMKDFSKMVDVSELI